MGDHAGPFPRLEPLKVPELSNTRFLKVCPNNNWWIVTPLVIMVAKEDSWTMPSHMMKTPRDFAHSKTTPTSDTNTSSSAAHNTVPNANHNLSPKLSNTKT